MARRPETGILKNEATAALARGKHKKALALYQELEMAEPEDGGWSRRAGELQRQLGDTRGAIQSFTRASRKYAEAGFLVKAIAVCKVILRLDPEHSLAQERLVELSAIRAVSHGGATESPTGLAEHAADVGSAGPVREAPPVRPAAPASARPGAPGQLDARPAALALGGFAGQALDRMPLADVVPGSVHRPGPGGGASGIHDIPIEFEDDGAPGDEVRETLAETPLFSALSAESLSRLIERVTLVELPNGQTLFRQGDVGRTLYVVSEGAVGVYKEGEPRVRLSRLEEGAFFGEIALVTDQPRSATIEAEGDAELLAIDRGVIAELVREEPEVLRVLLRFLRDRLLRGLVATSELFAPFAGAERRGLATRFRFLEVETGTELVRQGEEAEGLFVVLSGALSVTRAADGAERELACLGPGDVFGEMSLLAHQGAVASVRTATKVLALEMPAAQFREVIMTHPQVLAFVGDLASERERQMQAVVGGEEEWEELSLDLL